MAKSDGKSLVQEFYARTAGNYERPIPGAIDSLTPAVRHLSAYIDMLNISSILDVGCGGGRVLRYIIETHQGAEVTGVDPVKEFLMSIVNRHHIPTHHLVRGCGESLPFENGSYDAVCEFGVLHHVEEPDRVIKEMMRVSRKAIFISDSNRFGGGPIALRPVKLLLYKAHLWGIVVFIWTRGNGYFLDPNEKWEAPSYSYSVFDSYKLLSGWAKRIILVPLTDTNSSSWSHPLLTCPSILVCAIRNEPEEELAHYY